MRKGAFGGPLLEPASPAARGRAGSGRPPRPGSPRPAAASERRSTCAAQVLRGPVMQPPCRIEPAAAGRCRPEDAAAGAQRVTRLAISVLAVSVSAANIARSTRFTATNTPAPRPGATAT